MANLDALSDEALGRIIHREVYGWNEPYNDVGKDFGWSGCVRAAAAVRDHILRVLAEQAGDVARVGPYDEQFRVWPVWDSDGRTISLHISKKVADEEADRLNAVAARAVARAVAPLAAEVLALREGLRRCGELFGAIIGDWTDPRSECREGIDIADGLLARPVPDAAKRIAAVIQHARAVIASAQGKDELDSVSGLRALEDALRALDGGDGA
jgi:hypothetical protein